MKHVRAWGALGHALGLSLALLALCWPLGWALLGSFSEESRLFTASSPTPHSYTLSHYRALFSERAFWMPIRNSLIVAGITTVSALCVGTLCAYALARLRFPGRGVILVSVLSISMFPQISLVSPLYLLLRELRLIDSYPGLILPYLSFATPLCIWLLFGFFRQLPVALEEAAAVDGASTLRILLEIIAPLSAPALATTGVLVFIYCWNEFLFALSFSLRPERQTVPVAIALFRGQYRVPWGEVLAAAFVSTLPVAALVFAFQRRIVAGLVAGAVKG